MVRRDDHRRIIMFLLPHVHYIELEFMTRCFQELISEQDDRFFCLKSKSFERGIMHLTLLDASASERGDSAASSRVQAKALLISMSGLGTSVMFVK